MQFVRVSIVFLVLACLAVLPLAAQTTSRPSQASSTTARAASYPGLRSKHPRQEQLQIHHRDQSGGRLHARAAARRGSRPPHRDARLQGVRRPEHPAGRERLEAHRCAPRIGQPETTIEVSTGAILIETETARISDAKDAYSIKVLPLNTRDLWTYLSLTPGVVQAGAGSSTRRFAGSRANQSDASIDGITVSNGQDGTQISPLVSYVDSFQEFRVDMANNTAEYGSIGQVTIISKSGSNEFHGSVFDYYQTPFFRARNPFAAERGSGVRHWPGVAAGGPVVIPGLSTAATGPSSSARSRPRAAAWSSSS